MRNKLFLLLAEHATETGVTQQIKGKKSVVETLGCGLWTLGCGIWAKGCWYFGLWAMIEVTQFERGTAPIIGIKNVNKINMNVQFIHWPCVFTVKTVL